MCPDEITQNTQNAVQWTNGYVECKRNPLWKYQSGKKATPPVLCLC